jgi:hypothetical protein
MPNPFSADSITNTGLLPRDSNFCGPHWSTMKALSYNLKRLEVLIRLRKIPIDGIGVPA